MSELAEGGEERNCWETGPRCPCPSNWPGAVMPEAFAPKIEGPFCRPLGTQREEGRTAGGKKVGA